MTALTWIAVVVVALVLAAGGLWSLGQWRWQRSTRELRARLEAARAPCSQPARLQAGELDGLPPVVQRYLRTALPPDARIVAAADLAHRGSFDIRESGQKWVEFESTQRVVTRRPGFVWDARMKMLPGLAVHVHDAYVAGQGMLHPAIAGLVALADLRGGGDIARDELMRFLAEAAWYPTALLPGQGVRWSARDDRSARATLEDGPIAVTLTFFFGSDGMIESVRADARGRSVAGDVVPTPWEGRWSDYDERCGMRVPTRGEAAWLLPAGRKPYWRGTLTALRCEFAAPEGSSNQPR